MLMKAIEAKNHNFVAHDFSQQMLRDMMVTVDSEEQGERQVRLAWSSNKTLGKILYILFAFLFLPLLIIVNFFMAILPPVSPKSSFGLLIFKFFSYPLNRFVAFAWTSFIYICLVLYEANDESCLYLRFETVPASTC